MKTTLALRLLAVITLPAAALVLTASGAAAATDLYVDQANSACTDTGTGSSLSPYCTIVAAGTAAGPGMTVHVAPGTYGGQVTIAKSGTPSAPIVFTADPGAPVVVTSSGYGFYALGKSYLTIDGFEVTDTTLTGIYIKGGAFITVTDNHVSYAGQPVEGQTARGIAMSGTTDSLIARNLIDHNTDSGIFVTAGATRVTVSHNETTANARGYVRAAPGIDIRSMGNSVLFNRSHHNEDSGVQIRTGAGDSLVAGNLCWMNGDHGIDVLQAPGARILGNSVYKNVTAGINVEGDTPGSTGATVKDNISMDNGIGSPRTEGQIRVDKNSVSDTTADANLVWSSSKGAIIYVWGSTKYLSLNSFQEAVGQEDLGIQANPKFTDPARGNFALKSGSPAIDSADSGVAGLWLVDVYGIGRTDDPETRNTGVGPIGYADRGALEYS